MLSLTECVWDFQNNALWDTHLHNVRKGFFLFFGKMCFFLEKHTCAKQASLCDLLIPDFGHTKEWSAAPTVAVNLTPKT